MYSRRTLCDGFVAPHCIAADNGLIGYAARGEHTAWLTRMMRRTDDEAAIAAAIRVFIHGGALDARAAQHGDVNNQVVSLGPVIIRQLRCRLQIGVQR